MLANCAKLGFFAIRFPQNSGLCCLGLALNPERSPNTAVATAIKLSTCHQLMFWRLGTQECKMVGRQSFGAPKLHWDTTPLPQRRCVWRNEIRRMRFYALIIEIFVLPLH
jgi:hypothetical protein